MARVVEGALPQVHRLHVPATLIHACFPPPAAEIEASPGSAKEAPPDPAARP
jgi:hypothetical protein